MSVWVLIISAIYVLMGFMVAKAFLGMFWFENEQGEPWVITHQIMSVIVTVFWPPYLLMVITPFLVVALSGDDENQ